MGIVNSEDADYEVDNDNEGFDEQEDCHSDDKGLEECDDESDGELDGGAGDDDGEEGDDSEEGDADNDFDYISF